MNEPEAFPSPAVVVACYAVVAVAGAATTAALVLLAVRMCGGVTW